jgi:hypothetical protein
MPCLRIRCPNKLSLGGATWDGMSDMDPRGFHMEVDERRPKNLKRP